MKAQIDRIGAHWSRPWQHGCGLYWTDPVLVQKRLNAKASGDPNTDWLEYTLQRHFAGRLPLGRCLSLSCGHGHLERRLAKLGAFVACDAYDISAGAVRAARRSAALEGYENIAYAVQDVNTIRLSFETYDAVWAHASIHHFERLEHVFNQVAKALKPGGLFILNEYVGPSRFRFPRRQREVIRACHHLLPAEYCRLTAAALDRQSVSKILDDRRWLVRCLWDKLCDGDLAGALWRRLRRALAARTGVRPIRSAPVLPTARSVQAVDPSEAVRSAEILLLLRRYFEIVDYKPLGGSILQFLLADIAGNFRDEIGERLLEMLFAIEDALSAAGDLTSDFAYLVAVPLPAARPTQRARGGEV